MERVKLLPDEVHDMHHSGLRVEVPHRWKPIMQCYAHCRTVDDARRACIRARSAGKEPVVSGVMGEGYTDRFGHWNRRWVEFFIDVDALIKA